MHTSALTNLRRRGQFVITALCWAAAAGFVFAAAGWLLVFYHYGLTLADRLRVSLGFRPPSAGEADLFLLACMALPLFAAAAGVFALWVWYRRVWARRLSETWGDTPKSSQFARWSPERPQREAYLATLCQTKTWSVASAPLGSSEERARHLLEQIERDVIERSFTTGLVVGVSTHRALDLIAIFAAALELQLHILARLGKRPSLAAWRLLIERCGASLFINQYLTRQDALILNLAVKKAGLGLHAAGDAMDMASQQLTSHDLDLDDLLHLNKLDGVPLAGLATKGLEVAATMTLTVGKQGLHALGHLVETAGDDLAAGATAAAILYHHGMSLAADAVALDSAHRATPAMNRGFGEGLQRMASMAGTILLDCVRQRKGACRDVRMAAVKQLPKMAGGGIKDKVASWFKSEPAPVEPTLGVK